jgi:hypothetical protein
MAEQLAQDAPTASGPVADDEPKPGEKWWQSMLWAAVLLGGGIWLFQMFDDMEHKGGSMRMNVLVVGVYRVLGKWGVLGLFAVLSIGMAYLGVSQLRKQRAAA